MKRHPNYLREGGQLILFKEGGSTGFRLKRRGRDFHVVDNDLGFGIALTLRGNSSDRRKQAREILRRMNAGVDVVTDESGCEVWPNGIDPDGNYCRMACCRVANGGEL